MDEYRFFTSVYESLIEKSWMHPYTYTPLRRIIRKIANKRLPHYFENHSNRVDSSKTEEGIIVSFTSYPARIGSVHLVVQCMLNQTVKPEKILLWLSKKQFSDKSVLPTNLISLESECFEIRMVDDDIRSHKKYFYVCKEYPEAKVVLLDDDLFYCPNLIKRLLDAYLVGDADIISNYGLLIQRDLNGHILPYNQWKELRTEELGNEVFFGSGGGTLIRPCDFDPILMNKELALKLTPTADDIWLNSIARYSKLKIKMIKHGGLLPILMDNNESLYSSNINEHKNDLQISNICYYFGANDYLF